MRNWVNKQKSFLIKADETLEDMDKRAHSYIKTMLKKGWQLVTQRIDHRSDTLTVFLQKLDKRKPATE